MLSPVLYFTTPEAANYRPELLDGEDKSRLNAAPHLALRPDWRSSRYLKQLLPQPRPPFSLAHKKGHAVLFCADAVVGVDLEYIQKRDFAALLPWFCTAREQEWFYQCQDKCLGFYRLWTLKEALLKALRGDFADLLHLGSATPAPKGMRWQQFSYLADNTWLITVVAAASVPLPLPRTTGFTGMTLLPVEPLLMTNT